MTNKRKLVVEDIEDTVSPLTKILKQLEILRNWRVDKVADVDIYGCDKLAEPFADPKVRNGRLQVHI